MTRTKCKRLIAFFVLTAFIVMGFDIPIKPTLTVSATGAGSNDTVSIGCNGTIVDEVTLYTQSRQKLQCFIGNEPVTANDVQCKWEVLNGSEFVEFQDDNHVASTSATNISPYLYPKQIGNAEILLTVTKSGKEYPQKLLKVTVTKKKLMIDHSNRTDQNFKFEYIYEGDKTDALMISWNDAIGSYGTGTLQLFDASQADKTGLTWTSSDEDIVTVSAMNDIVTVKGTGAGHAKITAQNAAGESDTVDVYVKPKITIGGQNKSYYDITNGTVLETGVLFNTKVTQMLTQKISWAVYKFNTNNEKIFIRDSLGNKGTEPDVFQFSEVDGTPPKNLRVKARSGQYHVYFYPADTYNGPESSDSGNSGSAGGNDKKCLVSPVVVQLNVTNQLPKSDLTLNIGDAYNVASGLNITEKELNEWFVKPEIKDTTAVEYHADTTEIRAVGITDYVEVSFKPLQDAESKAKIKEVLGEYVANYGITFQIRVIDYFSLNSKVSLKVGESMKLLPNYSNKPEYNYEWTTSDASKVSVTQDGWITALQPTTDDVIITVSLKQNNEVIKRASCSVKVTSGESKITLNKTETAINVGETERITASITPASDDSEVHWVIEDEAIATIEENIEGKYADVTAVSTGTTTLIAMNSENYVLAFCKITVVQRATEITLDQTQLTVKLNREVVRLKATLAPENTTSTELIWTSTDTNVAVVDETGLVTLKSPGTTYISVKPKEAASDQVRAECRLTVVQSATSLSFAEKELTLAIGEEKQIGYTLQPENSTTVITWNTMNAEVATVNNTGMVTAVGVGQTYITAVTEEGYVATCLIKITQQATGVKLDVTELTLDAGDKYIVKYTLDPPDSTDPGLTWTSQNETIATVADGTITAVAPGTTTIFVKTKAGNVEYIFVTVRQSVKGLSLDKDKITIDKGETEKLEAVITPEGATNQKVTWKSSDETVVTISEAGEVTGKKGGVAVVTCTSEDGELEANCIVTVIEIATTVKLNKSSYTLGVGKSVKLKATVKSKSTTSKKVKWTSSNTKIAKVDSQGKVTGKKVGKCTITAKATDGSGEYAKCIIKVVRQTTSVSLNKMYVKMYVGASYKLKATLKPKNVTKKSLSWSSSNSDVVMVGKTGKIMALSVGRATVTVKTNDNSKKKAQCVIDVIERIPTTGITATETELLMVKGTSQSVAFNVSPANTTDKITYSSDNRSVATVNSQGMVHANNVGVANIVAKSSNGKYATITVTVVGLNKTSISLEQYSTDQLWLEGDAGLSVRWSSEDSGIARVDSSGNITARKVGSTRIIANVKGVKLYCTVNVTKIPKTK